MTVKRFFDSIKNLHNNIVNGKEKDITGFFVENDGKIMTVNEINRAIKSGYKCNISDKNLSCTASYYNSKFKIHYTSHFPYNPPRLEVEINGEAIEEIIIQSLLDTEWTPAMANFDMLIVAVYSYM